MAHVQIIGCSLGPHNITTALPTRPRVAKLLCCFFSATVLAHASLVSSRPASLLPPLPSRKCSYSASGTQFGSCRKGPCFSRGGYFPLIPTTFLFFVSSRILLDSSMTCRDDPSFPLQGGEEYDNVVPTPGEVDYVLWYVLVDMYVFYSCS